MYMSYRSLISCDLENLAHISRTACKSRVPSVTLTSHRGHWPLLKRVSGITWRGSKLLVNVILHTRYVSTCVGAVCVRGRGTKIKNLNLPSLRMKVPDYVYEWPKIYTWSGTFILKGGRYTFLFYLETALDVSGGTITHHQERKQLHLQYLLFVTTLFWVCCLSLSLSVLWVAYANHSTLKPVPNLPR
jgi:hypothetical protein